MPKKASLAASPSHERLHPDAERILKTLIQRVGGSVSMTEHDRQRADRYQLRFTDNGHTLSIKAVDDT